MNTTWQHDLNHCATVAIVGYGVGALIASSIFQAEGLSAQQIVVYGDQPDPLCNFRRYTSAIRQDRMRSESSGHFFPSDFPGFALLDSLRQRRPWPLLWSLFDAYSPRLSDWLAHGERIARALAPSFVQARIGRMTHERRESMTSFVLHDERGHQVGRAQHVLLALGHPALSWPSWLAHWRGDERITHAYQPKCYRAGETVIVLGAGMAAAHQWLAALEAGARVVAVSREPLRHQALNAPRCDFTAVGLEPYRTLDTSARHAYLDRLSRGTYPWRADWEWRLSRARWQGQWRATQADVLALEAYDDELIVRLSTGEAIVANRIVAATGFVSDVRAHPLIAQLADDYALPIERGRLLVNDDFTVSQLGAPDARVAVIGNLARWALPVGDTLMGMKYVARRLVHTLNLPTDTMRRVKNSVALMFG
jgi:hypothetical protein